MRNRKRFAIQPLLEPMEPRVVPSLMSLAAHDPRAAVAHLDHSAKTAKHPAENQHTINVGLRRLEQQLALIKTRSMERTPSAAETPAEKVQSETSSLLKNIEASL